MSAYFTEMRRISSSRGSKTGRMKVRQGEMAGRKDDRRIRDREKRRSSEGRRKEGEAAECNIERESSTTLSS